MKPKRAHGSISVVGAVAENQGSVEPVTKLGRPFQASSWQARCVGPRANWLRESLAREGSRKEVEGEPLKPVAPMITATQIVFPAGVFIFGPGFIHSDCAIAEGRTVERADGSLRLFRVGHLEERETA